MLAGHSASVHGSYNKKIGLPGGERSMMRLLSAIVLAMALGAIPAAAQDKGSGKSAKPAPVKVGKDEKLCRYRFPSGERREWVCKKVEPCCAWDAISYVKCGSTITGCL
jgi:hypothetical protein